MTTNDRIHEQGFCYDAEHPPSVAAGKPLRGEPRPEAAAPPARPSIRRSCGRALASLRTRFGA